MNLIALIKMYWVRIIVAILAIGIILGGIYLAFFHSFEEAENTVSVIENTPFISVITTTPDSVKYFNRQNNTIYEKSKDGSAQKLAEFERNPVRINFSEKGDTAIVKESLLEFDDPYQIFDFSNKKSRALDPNIRSIAFSPDSSKIAYFYKDITAQKAQIRIADIDGKNESIIYDIPYTEEFLCNIIWQNDYILVLPASVIGSPVAVTSIKVSTKEIVNSEKKDFYSVRDGVDDRWATAVINIDTRSAGLAPYTFGAIYFMNIQTGELVEAPSKLIGHGSLILKDTPHGKVYIVGYVNGLSGLYEMYPNENKVNLIQEINNADKIKKLVYSEDKKQAVTISVDGITNTIDLPN